MISYWLAKRAAGLRGEVCWLLNLLAGDRVGDLGRPSCLFCESFHQVTSYLHCLCDKMTHIEGYFNLEAEVYLIKRDSPLDMALYGLKKCLTLTMLHRSSPE